MSEVFPPMPGGSGRWLWELYRRLPDVDVAVLAGPAGGAAEFDATAGLRIDRSQSRFSSWGVLTPARIRAYLTAARGATDLAREVRASALHCGRCLPEGLVALLVRGRTRLPFCCFAHGEELTLVDGSRELRMLARAVLARAHRVVANSAHTRGLLVDRWRLPPDRVVVLRPGVDTERFVPVPLDGGIRARLGWTGRRVVLTVGALQARKGQDMMIRALPTIRKRVPEVLYAIAGQGWERARLEGLAAELGVRDSVVFQGVPTDTDLVQLYQQCDLFALPNRQVGWDFEGFGIVLLEAQACGKAVVTGRSGGTAEALLPGSTGELVNCDTPEGLADICTRLLSDRSRLAALGTRARAWMQEEFAWDRVIPRAADMLLDGDGYQVR